MKFMSQSSALFVLVQIVFCLGTASALSPYQQDLEKLMKTHSGPKAKINQFYKLNWDYMMTTYPEWATYTGYPGQNGRWTDQSREAIDLRKEESKSSLKFLKTIPFKKLAGEDLISYNLAVKNLELSIEGDRFPGELIAIHQMGGIQQDISELMFMAPKKNLQDYRDMLARLKASPKAMEQVQKLLAEGLKQKVTPAKIALTSVPSQFDQQLTANPEESPIFEPFKEIKIDITAAEKEKLQKEALHTLKEEVFPALKKLQAYFKTEYLPNCRESVSWTSVPNGKEWYAFKAKFHTTTNLTPDEIHELGLKEVARIRIEMEKIKDQVKFKGDLKKFNEFLKTDSQFYYTNPKDLMSGFRDISKRIDPELPKLFRKLPRLTYGIREMPAFKATSAPTAYYNGGSLEFGRPGYFEANTYNLKARPKWQMEALTLHEAVPGHHLQISIAQEIEGLPEFRKNTGPTAFVEGWGLYAEGLGSELGMYQDPYSKYGQLTFEIWRAIRLVVDTGLHSKGWTRDQVIQYFKDNSPISEQQIINETDRYIADPGQALAYKIGQLKFKELREKSKAIWGDQFDIRSFHDQLLGSGALPLDVIEKKILSWTPTLDTKKK